MRWQILLLIVLLIGVAVADRIPPQTPENQVYSIDTTLRVTGIIDESTKIDWTVAREGPLENTILNSSEALSLVEYRDAMMSNGGTINEVKNNEFSSTSKGRKSYNIDQEKILTYLGQEGSHLFGGESMLMDNAGNYSNGSSTVRCAFAEPAEVLVPVFCTVVRAKSDLININHAKISTKGEIRSIGGFSTPAGMNYQIAVTPDGTSGFAEGTVNTEFAGSIMEARDTDLRTDSWNKTAAENSWKDTTQETGGIRNLQKTFGYVSGLRI